METFFLKPIVITDLRPGEEDEFRRLNLLWIERYFAVEEPDRLLFADPWKAVIEPGGSILFARLEKRIVGTCALLRHDAAVWELAKMAVEEVMQGLGIGEQLGRGIIDRARRNGGRTLFLESNDRLTPAINLYLKLGFRHAGRPGDQSAYSRANVHMVLDL